MKRALLICLAFAMLVVTPLKVWAAAPPVQEYTLESTFGGPFPAILPCEIIVSRQAFAEAEIRGLIIKHAKKLMEKEKTRINALYILGVFEISPWTIELSEKAYFETLVELEKELAKQQKEIAELTTKAIRSKKTDDWALVIGKRETTERDTAIANWLWHDFLAKRASPCLPPPLGPQPLTDAELEKTTAP